MIRLLTAMAVLTLLANCGADGEPIQPKFKAGIGLSPNGVNLRGGVNLRQGPFSINLGV